MAVEGLARIYVDRGLPMNKAVAKAAEDVQRTYTPINGVLVNTRDKFIPPNFADITKVTLEDYAAVNGVDPDEITLMPVQGQQAWIVTDQFFNPMPNARPISITKLQKNPRAYSMADANREVQENR